MCAASPAAGDARAIFSRTSGDEVTTVRGAANRRRCIIRSGMQVQQQAIGDALHGLRTSATGLTAAGGVVAAPRVRTERHRPRRAPEPGASLRERVHPLLRAHAVARGRGSPWLRPPARPGCGHGHAGPRHRRRHRPQRRLLLLAAVPRRAGPRRPRAAAAAPGGDLSRRGAARPRLGRSRARRRDSPGGWRPRAGRRRLLEAVGLRVNNSTLTGESVAMALDTRPSQAEDLVHARNVALAGTSVVSGRGTAVVFATGSAHAFAKIARLAQHGARGALAVAAGARPAQPRRGACWRSASGSVFFAGGLALGLPLSAAPPLRRRHHRRQRAGGAAADGDAVAGDGGRSAWPRARRWCATSRRWRRWARPRSSAPTRPARSPQNRMTVRRLFARRRGPERPSWHALLEPGSPPPRRPSKRAFSATTSTETGEPVAARRCSATPWRSP